jgi:CheY-like chemotaxis protein
MLMTAKKDSDTASTSAYQHIITMKRLDLIFIVDDDPIHQQVAQIMIKRQGISKAMKAFSDAQEALDYLQQHQHNSSELPEVILLDLNMPVMDGWDFLDRYTGFYKDLSRDIKIFVLTSSIDEKDRERVTEYPFVSGYLTKPLSSDVIQQLLE